MSTQMTDNPHDHDHDHDQDQDRPRRGWRDTPVSRLPKGGPEGGRLGGVVAGVSRAYGFDLRTTRIAVAIATLVLPVLAVVYVVAWMVLPATPEAAQPLEDLIRDRRRLPLLIAIGLVIVFGGIGSFGSWFVLRGVPWGLALIAVGVVLWVNAGHGGTSPRPPSPPSTGTPSRAPRRAPRRRARPVSRRPPVNAPPVPRPSPVRHR